MSRSQLVPYQLWTRELLRKQLLKFHFPEYQWSKLSPALSKQRKAAVLIPLFVKEGCVYVWLTQRSEKVSHDKGHVAFPGGMHDATDANEVVTCLREAEEEINLDPKDVEIVSVLPPTVNMRQTLVSPIAGIVSEKFKPRPNEEVSLAFSLPLRRFLSNEGHRTQKYDNRGITNNIHFYTDRIDGETVTTWGLTATRCLELAVAVFQEKPQFESERFSDPTDPFIGQRYYMQKFEEDISKDSKL